jgi:hypothetical protein
MMMMMMMIVEANSLDLELAHLWPEKTEKKMTEDSRTARSEPHTSKI